MIFMTKKFQHRTVPIVALLKYFSNWKELEMENKFCQKNIFFLHFIHYHFLIVLFNLKIAIQSISKKDILVKKISFTKKLKIRRKLVFMDETSFKCITSVFSVKLMEINFFFHFQIEVVHKSSVKSIKRYIDKALTF